MTCDYECTILIKYSIGRYVGREIKEGTFSFFFSLWKSEYEVKCQLISSFIKRLPFKGLLRSYTRFW